MNWQGRRVLVTGAGGFIGSHLSERLVHEGARVRAFVHYNSLGAWGWLDQSALKSEIEVVAGNIRDRDSIDEAVKGVEIILHLAALIAIPYSYRSPVSYIRTNVEGTLNVLQAARLHSVERVVHTSTSEVYGSARSVPIDEGHPLQGQSPYSASKIGADKMAEAFHHSFGLPVTTVRPFNTYGPRQSSRAIIPTVILQILHGDTLMLGNLSPTRDFNFVLDTVEGFVKAAASKDAVGRVVNIGSGKEISIGGLVDRISKLIGKEVKILVESDRVRPEGSEVQRLCASNELARNLIGWQPHYSLDEGLQQTIDWIGDNIERFRPGQYTI